MNQGDPSKEGGVIKVRNKLFLYNFLTLFNQGVQFESSDIRFKQSPHMTKSDNSLIKTAQARKKKSGKSKVNN